MIVTNDNSTFLAPNVFELPLLFMPRMYTHFYNVAVFDGRNVLNTTTDDSATFNAYYVETASGVLAVKRFIYFEKDRYGFDHEYIRVHSLIKNNIEETATVILCHLTDAEFAEFEDGSKRFYTGDEAYYFIGRVHPSDYIRKTFAYNWPIKNS